MPIVLPLACIKVGNMSDDNLLIYANNILVSLTGNLLYTTPPVTIVALGNLMDEYQAALSAAADGGKQLNQAKKAARVLLVNALRTNLFYINQVTQAAIAAGTWDYATASANILTTGYELKENPSPAGELTAPVIETYRSFNIGELYLKTNKIKGAKSYQTLYRPVTIPESNFSTFVSPTTRVKIKGLDSGVQYEAKTTAVGSNPARNYSPSIFQVVI